MSNWDPIDLGTGLQQPFPGRPAWARRRFAGAKRRFEGSMAHNVLSQLNELKFGDQVLLFGGGALVTVLPLLILLSAFASRRFDHGIAVHLGLDRRAADVASRLFTSSPATLNADTVTSLVIVGAGAVAITSSIRQIYEKIFHQHHRGLPFLWRRLSWVGVMCVVVALETTTARCCPQRCPWRTACRPCHVRVLCTVFLVDDALLPRR